MFTWQKQTETASQMKLLLYISRFFSLFFYFLINNAGSVNLPERVVVMANKSLNSFYFVGLCRTLRAIEWRSHSSKCKNTHRYMYIVYGCFSVSVASTNLSKYTKLKIRVWLVFCLWTDGMHTHIFVYCVAVYLHNQSNSHQKTILIIICV